MQKGCKRKYFFNTFYKNFLIYYIDRFRYVDIIKEKEGDFMDYKKTANLFKALADENRLQIMEILKDGEKCACKLLEALQISQPTLSHHMKILCDAELVSGRKEGKWMYYSISKAGIKSAKAYLKELKISEGK